MPRMSDYLREIDLNPPPAAGGPVTNPLDPRAMHYFGFLANGQEIVFVPPFTGANPRVAVSWHYGNQPTAAPAQPPPPIDAIVDFSGGPPGLRYELNHDRRHVLVWLDMNGTAPPPPGQPVLVRVRAWARE